MITVGDVENTCERFGKLGVAFKKKPEDGKMKCIELILDHNGFIESRAASCILVLTICLIMQVLG